MADAITSIPLIYAQNAPISDIEAISQLVAEASLPLHLQTKSAQSKLTHKARQQLSNDYAKPVLVFDEKQGLSLLVNGISVSPEWATLQRRITSAGRKSELILQACKLTQGNRVLDATAGFGHDSLILGSTGASVTMLERNPLICLLLRHEQKRMSKLANWQKLMVRLDIHFAESLEFMAQSASVYDVVYLDPMFPDSSYTHTNSLKGAKVGKHMQALHHLTQPPDNVEENRLLVSALDCTAAGGRVIIKRPITAPNLAQRCADEVWQNNVVRFDGYFKQKKLTE